LNAYDGQAAVGTRPPLATKQIMLPPLGRFAGLLTEIFPSVNFLSYTNSVGTIGLLQGFLSATSTQNFGLAVLRQDFAVNGAITSTLWSAFPAATPPAGPTSYLTVTQPTNCSGAYSGTITASASVPWAVYVNAGKEKVLVTQSGPTVDVSGALGSTMVNWLVPGEYFTLVAQSNGEILQSVTLTPPGSCKGQ
jgi:hypothetical protein